MALHPRVLAALEEIDAQMFSGDPAESKETWETLNEYVQRWSRKLELCHDRALRPAERPDSD